MEKSARTVLAVAVAVALVLVSFLVGRLTAPVGSPSDQIGISDPLPEAPAEPAAPVAEPKPNIHKFGDSTTVDDGDATVKVTVHGFEPEVTVTADPEPGQYWAAADVELCMVSQRADFWTNSLAWHLIDRDHRMFGAASTGYEGFPVPEFTSGDLALAPGQCARGWVTFDVTEGSKLTGIVYGSEAVLAGWQE